MNTHTVHVGPLAAETAAQLAATLVDDLREGLSVNALETIAELRLHLDAAERTAARHARQAGNSWEVIGEAAGISKQAAHKKFRAVDAALELEPAREPMPGEQQLPLDEPAGEQLPLIVIPCGASKDAAPQAARDLYRGQHFRLALAAAERLALKLGGAHVRILSAEHGLLELDETVAPYEHKLSRADLAGNLPDAVAGQLDAIDPAMVYALTPKLYTELLATARARQALAAHDAKHVCPDDCRLAGCGDAACATLVAPLEGTASQGEQRAILSRIKGGAWA